MQELTIKVKGMVCGGCENRVKNAVSAVEGIKKVKANHKTGEVKIKGEEINQKEIEEKIQDIGFEVEQ